MAAVLDFMEESFPARAQAIALPDRGGFIDFLGKLDLLKPGSAHGINEAVKNYGDKPLFKSLVDVGVIPESLYFGQSQQRISDNLLMGNADSLFARKAREIVLDRFDFIRQQHLNLIFSDSEILQKSSRLFNALNDQQQSLSLGLLAWIFSPDRERGELARQLSDRCRSVS